MVDFSHFASISIVLGEKAHKGPHSAFLKSDLQANSFLNMVLLSYSITLQQSLYLKFVWLKVRLCVFITV